MPKKKSETEILAGYVAEGLAEKKGKDIVLLDLKDVENAVAGFFVVCHGTSRTQVEALADSVRVHVGKKMDMKPWHHEGFENAEWILLDYVDVVVHIFQKGSRDFYQLETLWADAKITHYKYKD
jgi:ribosome-associated protein